MAGATILIVANGSCYMVANDGVAKGCILPKNARARRSDGRVGCIFLPLNCMDAVCVSGFGTNWYGRRVALCKIVFETLRHHFNRDIFVKCFLALWRYNKI